MAPTPRTSPALRTTDRRAFLLGAAGLAGGALLAGCSSGGSTSGSGTTAGGGASSVYLVNRFDPNTFAVVGGEQRLVFSLLAGDGSPLKGAPATLTVTVTRDGQPVGGPITVQAHSDGIPIAYYPLRFTPTATGVHTATAQVNGSAVSQQFMVSDSSPVPKVGAKLPVTDTPTTTDGRGVDPICTRTPTACGFHQVNLRDALGSGKPTVLLVSTPAYCQIGICGPVLDLVTEVAPAHGGVQVVHAEVYKSREPSGDNLAPIMESLGLDYEPALFAVDPSGTIVQRLDTVFDRTEIQGAFTALKA